MGYAQGDRPFDGAQARPLGYAQRDRPFDVERYCAVWRETKAELETALGHDLVMEVEPGRYLVAEAGLLLTEVRGAKTSGGLNYILVDAGFDNLVRPALYGAYAASMASNYNSRPLAAEVLVEGDQARLVRERQELGDLLAREVDRPVE